MLGLDELAGLLGQIEHDGGRLGHDEAVVVDDRHTHTHTHTHTSKKTATTTGSIFAGAHSRQQLLSFYCADPMVHWGRIVEERSMDKGTRKRFDRRCMRLGQECLHRQRPTVDIEGRTWTPESRRCLRPSD